MEIKQKKRSQLSEKDNFSVRYRDDNSPREGHDITRNCRYWTRCIIHPKNLCFLQEPTQSTRENVTCRVTGAANEHSICILLELLNLLVISQQTQYVCNGINQSFCLEKRLASSHNLHLTIFMTASLPFPYLLGPLESLEDGSSRN